MRRRSLLNALLIFLLPWACGPKSGFVFSADEFRVRVDGRGAVTSLSDLGRGREYLAPNQPAPLLSVKI